MNVAPLPTRQQAPRPARFGVARISVVASGRDRTMPTNDELNAWMDAVARTGDRQAFAAVFKHFAPRIKSYLMRAGDASELAEEMAQETMVLLWRRAGTFDPARASLSTWLFAIARNVRIDHHRRLMVDAQGSADSVDPWAADQQTPDAGIAPEDAVVAIEHERRISRAMAELPAEQAMVLRLSFFEEHPHARIAQQLGLPLGTVKSRIRLAVSQLRRKLCDLDHD